MTHSDFWHAIREAPDDDTPRLVYADWLDEYGEDGARAEFIRLQIRAARLNEDDREWPGLQKRIGQLMAQHAERWLRPLHGNLPPAVGREAGVAWSRGFVYYLHFQVYSADALDHAAPFLREHPLERLILSPEMKVFKASLDTAGQMVARCSHLDNLGDLEIHGWEGRVRAETMDMLGKAPHLSRLRYFYLGGDNTLATLRALFRSGLLDRITGLGFSVADGIEEQALALLAGGRAARLEMLEPPRNTGDNGIRTLCNSQHLPALRRLDLSSKGLTDVGVSYLAESSLLGQLESLNLMSSSFWGSTACRHLGQSGKLSNLVELNLGFIRIDGDGIRALLPGLNPERFRVLALACSDLEADAMVSLAGSPQLAGLRSLDLGGNGIGDRGAIALAGSPYLAGLRKLELDDTGIKTKGARALVESPYLTKLNDLTLSKKGIPTAQRQLLQGRFGDALTLK